MVRRFLLSTVLIAGGFAAGLVVTGRMRTAGDSAAQSWRAPAARPAASQHAAPAASVAAAAAPDFTRVAGAAVKGCEGFPWGDSSQLKVGEWGLASGSPFQLSQTVTAGIVSATGRNDLGFTQYEDFIQTDAAINPGNSGGALVNTRGDLVAMNTGIYRESGGYPGLGIAV